MFFSACHFVPVSKLRVCHFWKSWWSRYVRSRVLEPFENLGGGENLVGIVYPLPLLIEIKTDRKWMSLYKWPLYNLFWPFFHHMHVHLSQNWGSDGHFEVLNKSYLWLGQILWPKTKIFPFLFLLRFCTKTKI